MPKVSVIVPVYNTEKYVERAIVSLMTQTLADVEFIIIDDGSKDNSLFIIQQVIELYPERKNKITLISRENRGVAATRAQGMELAKGEYTIHLDSDDWAESHWLESMYSKAIKDNADIVLCDYKIIYERRTVIVHQQLEKTGKECIRKLLAGKIGNINWDKLVRRSLYFDNDIKFVDGLDMGEDFLVTLRLFFFAKKISHVSAVSYNYNKINDGSLTNKYSEKSLNDIVSVAQLAELFLINNNSDIIYKEEMTLFKINNVRTSFIMHARGDSSIKRRGLKLYTETNYLISDPRVSKLFKMTYFLDVSGLFFLHRIIDFVFIVFNYFKFGR